MQLTDNWVRVWDPLIRLFHWGLVLSFLIAFLTEDDWLQLHVLAGYTVLGLIGFRLLWGLVGSRHARFANFVQGPRRTWAYLHDMLLARPRRYLGHNPAGAAMVVSLLITLALTTVTGLMTYGHEEFAGPLAGFMAHQPHWLGEALEEAHEFLANLTLLLVGLHVGGVLLASVQHRENLVRSMLHGFKRKEVQ
jgi:cytochrome b